MASAEERARLLLSALLIGGFFLTKQSAILTESARLYALDGAPSFAAQQPIERLIDPTEIAATIAFLCSPAGAAITGTTVSVDGGLSV